MWDIERSSKFNIDYKNLSHEARSKCDEVVEELRRMDDPREYGERMVGMNAYKTRYFGSYRLVYTVGVRAINVIGLERTGHGHNAY